VRVVELAQEEHFSEGEPDLEPPEELAVAELDDETMLEEELDNEDIAEDDVDDDVLTATLEDLVHIDDDDDVVVEGGAEVTLGNGALEAVEQVEVLEVLELLDVDEIEDLEESLDHVLAQRLAQDADGAGAVEPDDESDPDAGSDSRAGGHAIGLNGLNGSSRLVVAGCSADEFVCRGCFLVRNRVQLADPAGVLCRDCAS